MIRKPTRHHAVRAAAILVILTSTAASPAAAVTPLGIESCDVFLAAYAQCAASPGVPETVRPGLQQGIGTMRESFRASVVANEAARRTVAYQCAQAHNIVRKRLIEAFRCDFPDAPPASQALLQTPPSYKSVQPSERSARVTSSPNPEAQEVTKANAYTEAQNHLVRSHPLERQLAEYRRDNERVLKFGTKLRANAWYHFSIVNFDGVIDELDKAVALPGAIPEVDEPAAKLLAALREVNPTLKALARYQTTREFKEDGYRFAREQHLGSKLRPRPWTPMAPRCSTARSPGTSGGLRRCPTMRRRAVFLPPASSCAGRCVGSRRLGRRRTSRRS